MCNSRFIVLSLVAALMLALPAASSAQVSLSITIAPPMLPVYSQPACPAPNYMWTPGYWAYGSYGYYWVPGTWVEPPQVGFLWTPGYWGWAGGSFIWNVGYWGPQIGFYGGVSYGFGYDGVGYDGGYWRGRDFYYNRNVANVNVNINRNVYDRPVANRQDNRVSYNGGNGGIMVRPNHEQEMAAREQHRPPTSMQTRQEQGASRNRELQASVNHGVPAVAATERPGVFEGRGVVAAKGTPGNASGTRPEPRRGNHDSSRPSNNAAHPNNAQPTPMMQHKAAPGTANRNPSKPALDKAKPEPNNEKQKKSQ